MKNDFEQFEHSGWQSSADGYAERWTDLTSSAVPRLLQSTAVTTGTRLLDVACGPGHLSEAAHQRGAKVIGVDFSARMVDIARTTYPHLDLREGDALKLPFDNESFDAVVMSFGMLHVDDPRRAMSEAARVLRPRGRFAFTVWATPDRAEGFRIVLDAVAKYGTKVELPRGPDFFTYADPQRAKDDLEASGFDEVSSTEIDMTWKLASPDDVYASFFTGTARTGALLRAQDVDTQALIEKEVSAQARAYAANDGSVEIPMPAVMSHGHKR